MSAIHFKEESLEPNRAEISAREKSAGATLVGLRVVLARSESTSRIPGLCSRCVGHRDPRTSTANYPNIFCSEKCEQEFVRAALASLTLDDCLRIQARLDELIAGAQPASEVRR
jgi:hypothetical protein